MALILDDSIFSKWGGDFGESLPFVRSAAYGVAESLVAEHIGTFLVPTDTSGTHAVNYNDPRVILHHSHLRSINNVTGYWLESTDWSVDSATGTVSVISWDNSIVRVVPPDAHCAPCSYYGHLPERYLISYTAGLNPGQFEADERAMTALILQAKIALGQLVDPSSAEGGAGDPGVNSWSDGGHSETRVFLRRTTFGTSAIDNYCERLLKHLRHLPPLKLP